MTPSTRRRRPLTADRWSPGVRNHPQDLADLGITDAAGIDPHGRKDGGDALLYTGPIDRPLARDLIRRGHDHVELGY
jgi:hypothetical protein